MVSFGCCKNAGEWVSKADVIIEIAGFWSCERSWQTVNAHSQKQSLLSGESFIWEELIIEMIDQDSTV